MFKEKDACENRDSQAFFFSQYILLNDWQTSIHPTFHLIIISSLSQSRAQTKFFFWLLLMRERYIDEFLVVAPCVCWIPEKKQQQQLFRYRKRKQILHACTVLNEMRANQDLCCWNQFDSSIEICMLESHHRNIVVVVVFVNPWIQYSIILLPLHFFCLETFTFHSTNIPLYQFG